MMKPPVTAFTALYTEWLHAFRQLLPGGAAARPAEPTPRQAQVAADQEWEDEGGCIKPEKKPEAEPAPKIPF